ncbi:trypsin-like peptidase domain-containing protein [Bradyrhizobium sp. CCBAU 45394]|uniref:trypsin-like peptidase domain-containing protein n=1 Tax=Bradyrhizobium sp. CCBAU 45394 TaxID=1325087 RepID=UPI002302C419|nr:trypsin-like peptidase domain-containing protein [Bradyrhizobium sp. CCBAU 45394]
MTSQLDQLSAIRDVLSGSLPAGHESAAPAASHPVPVAPDSILHRVSTSLDLEAKRRGAAAGGEFDKARSLLIGHGADALRKLAAGDGPENFSDDEIGSLEAVVQFDGSRPAFVLRNGVVDPNHPFLGRWTNDIRGDVQSIRQFASSVGRLEPSGGGPLDFFGTGYVIDCKAMIVMTAGHVFDQILKRVGRKGSNSADVFEFGDEVRIDFDGEADAPARHLLKVEAGVRVGTSADAALLAVRPLKEAEDADHAEAEVPAQIGTRLVVPPGGKPIPGSLCVIGFPARFSPPRSVPDGHSVDWEWVRHHLTGGAQGVKRLAPGLPKRQPELHSDATTFGHDATTAGGNSGSPVIAWKDEDQPAIGVHVSGTTFVTNQAEFLASIGTDLDCAMQTLRKWRK